MNRDDILRAARAAKLDTLHVTDANQRKWRVIDLAWSELQSFYQAAYEAGAATADAMIATLDQESRQMRARMERLQQETERDERT
jgi:ribosomal silencing factor RsfS